MLFMAKSTISMAIFNSFLYVYQKVPFGKQKAMENPMDHDKPMDDWIDE